MKEATSPLESCSCAACAALRRQVSPALRPLYGKKLLRRGWAGHTSPTEKAYQQAHAAWAQTLPSQNLPRPMTPVLPETPSGLGGLAGAQGVIR